MNYNYVKTPALSIMVAGGCIFALVKRGNLLSVIMLDKELKSENEIASLNASRGLILGVEEDRLLLSIDDKLVLVEGGNQKIVLKSNRSANFFWHATRAEGEVFVQEYGEPPTGIFASEDFRRWKKLVVSTDLDKRSKHFHYITYDSQRKWLIATLGDGCLTRVVFSEDLGSSWGPLYRGPWQFVPVVSLGDKIVFGMDSGIAKGGLGIYYPDEGKWDFIFVKWVDKNIKHAQFCDLRFLSRFWIASLGTPQAVMVSKDLRLWFPLFVEDFSEDFNHNMLLSVGESMVACSTGKTLLILDKDEIERAFALKPIMVEYKAYGDKLMGYGFLAKHGILHALKEGL
jgi:hypothetical protein